MAPKYKLTYFDIKGLGEPIRYLLSYGGVDFEDNRIKIEDWPKVKSTMPYGKMPLLEVDGKEVYQSSAIGRYLAKQFKLYGSDDWEALQVDSTVDTITDLRIAIAGACFEENEAAKAKKMQTLQKETLPLYLSMLDKQLKDNGGHFVGGKLTWADLLFASMNDPWGVYLGGKPPIADYPNLKIVYDKVHALPAIKAWVAKRPVTQW